MEKNKGRQGFNHTLAFVFLGAFVGFLIGFYSRDFLLPPSPPSFSRFVPRLVRKRPRTESQATPPAAAKQAPQTPKKNRVETRKAAAAPPPIPEKPPERPRVAFIIDDFGNSLQVALPFLKTPYPIALSVLPDLEYSAAVAGAARKAGKPLLLHLPLEAYRDNQYMGPGGLFTNMNDTTLRARIEEDLQSVPGAEGLNNHMGSKASSDPHVARVVALEAKSHHLFVVDSLTAPTSVLYQEAQKAGVPSARREVFLDDTVKKDYIQGQVEALIRVARETGQAIAIGHPHPETLEVLMQAIPKIKKEGIEVVPVTDLVHAPL